MTLWIEILQCLRHFREACSRKVTFFWMACVIVSMMVRPDHLGVSSFVRASFLQPESYRLLLNFFHCDAVSLETLTRVWVRLALSLFRPLLIQDHLVLLADGLKIPKEGRKMPAVKCLHQESEDNAKKPYIMGHSFQAITLVTQAKNTAGAVAVPLISRICEGLVWGREKGKTQLDKLVDLFLEIVIPLEQRKVVLVADAYYASRKTIVPLLAYGYQLISRAKINSVAYEPPPPVKIKKRGRPRIYGKKIRLKDLFLERDEFERADSPVYGERGVEIQYRVEDLLWRPVGHKIRFILVRHPTRGKMILLCTSFAFEPLEVIRAYGLRFKIEVSFKQALHTLGAYSYRFWMKGMKPTKRGEGNREVWKMSSQYKTNVKRKIGAYHRHVQLGCIAQGLLLHLAVNWKTEVWSRFQSWLRTQRTQWIPSEFVVSMTLRTYLPEFLLSRSKDNELQKFILDHAELEKIPGFRMVA